MSLACRLVAVAVAFLALSSPAAEPWPTRPIILVAPGAPGGTSDIFARLLAHGLSAELGHPVVVENRSGAGTMLASQWVSRAKPDGHVLLIGMAALAISPHVYPHMNVDPVRDFQPIRLVARSPNLVAVSAASAVMDMPQLLREIRANPKRFNYSSGGVGISEHLSAELFMAMTGVELVHVPYKTSADSVMAVAKGEALVTFGNMAVALPQVRAGKIRAIAVTGNRRFADLPDVPTVEESGVNGYEVSAWTGLLAPAGTPSDVVRRLDHAARRFLSTREARERFAAAGAEVVDEGPEAFAAVIRADSAKWGDLIRKTNLRMQ